METKIKKPVTFLPGQKGTYDGIPCVVEYCFSEEPVVIVVGMFGDGFTWKRYYKSFWHWLFRMHDLKMEPKKYVKSIKISLWSFKPDQEY